MPANVTQCRSSQYRVTYSMQQHIRVGMPQQTFLVGNGHSADNKLTTLDQLVYIKTLPDSESVHYHLFLFNSGKNMRNSRPALSDSPGGA